jgi:hypothetical protein
MAARLYKRYVNLSNIIIRLSDGTDQGKVDAVLINSHLDSTLPSPGAADDALAVGVMIECVRVLVNTPGWEPKHAVIFCESSLISDTIRVESMLMHPQYSIMRRSLFRMGLTFSPPNILLRLRVSRNYSSCYIPSYIILPVSVPSSIWKVSYSHIGHITMQLIQVCSCWHRRP